MGLRSHYAEKSKFNILYLLHQIIGVSYAQKYTQKVRKCIMKA